MKKIEALAPFQAIKKQLEQIAATLGLHLEMFGMVILDDGDLCEFQVQFVIRPEAVMSEAEREQADVDRVFTQMERAEKERERREEELPRTIAEINKWIEEDE